MTETTAAPRAGSAEWWLTHDEPRTVPLEDAEPGSARRKADRELRVIRPGMRAIPHDNTDLASDPEYDAWTPDDFDPSEFEPPQFDGWRSRDDSPANWELALDEAACASGCGRPKAPNRRQCWACIKRQQRRRNVPLVLA
jgi:hypothetical protein